MWWIEGMLSEYYMSWYHSHLMEVVGFDFIYLSEDIWRVWQDLAFFVRMLSHARIERVCCPGQEDGCWLEATRGLGGEVRERWPPHQGRDHLTSDTENQQERIWKNMMERDGTRWNENKENNEHVMRAANSIIQQVLEESLLVDTLTWHDFAWLSRRWMVLVRRRSTTPRQQNAVNLAARKTFSLSSSLWFFRIVFSIEFWSGSGCESCRGQGVTENAG